MKRQHVGILMLTLLLAGCASSQPATGTIMIGNIPFRYVREGSGPTVAVVGSGVYYPKAYSPDLRKHFDMIFVDARYNIPSYQPTDEEIARITFETFADDLEEVRRLLGVQHWAVIGHSISAQTAIAYAKKYPKTTTRLVVIDGVPFSESEFRAEAEKFFRDDASLERKTALAQASANLDSVLAATAPERRMAVAYNAQAAMNWADPHYDATKLLDGFAPSPAFERLTTGVRSKSEMREMLHGIGPIMWVHGRLDYNIPYFAAQQLLEGLPNSTYRLLESDGHNPMTEAPERFNPVLIDFLTKP